MAEQAPGGAYDALPEKRKAFVNAFLSNGFNATEAARVAGYSQPAQQGSRLLTFVEIQQALQERQGKAQATADDALQVLSSHLNGKLEDFLETVEEPLTEEQKAVGAKPKKTTRFSLEKAQGLGRSRNLKKVKLGKGGEVEEFELYSAQEAAEKILKAAGRYVHKHEHSGPGGKPIEIRARLDLKSLSDEELEAREKEIREALDAEPLH